MDYIIHTFSTESDMTKTQRQTITAKAAAEIYGCDSRTIRRMIDRGELEGYQIDGGETLPYVVYLDSLEALMHQKQKERDQSSH